LGTRKGILSKIKDIKDTAAADKAAYRAAKAHVEVAAKPTKPQNDDDDNIEDVEKEVHADKWKIGHKTPSRLVDYDATTATNIDFYREYLAQRLHNGTWDAPMSTRDTDITLGYRKIFTKSTETDIL